MKTIWYYQGKKTTKKNLEAVFGKERVAYMLEQAKETYMQDPYIEISFANGVAVEFKL